MPAMAATQDQTMLKQAAKAMQYIIGKQIELSGATSAKEIGLIWKTGDTELVNSRDARIAALEESIGNYDMLADLELDEHNAAIAQLQQQMHQMAENQQLLLEKLGVMGNGSAGGSPSGPEVPAGTPAPAPPPPSLLPASA
jgi:uncharacterized coiled-coil protein SlyX